MLVFFFVTLIIVIIFCQYELIKANRQLTSEQRKLETDLTTLQQLIYSCVILAGFILIVVIPSLYSWLTLLIVLSIAVICLQFAKIKRLQKMHFPQGYVQKTILITSINYLAEFGLLFCFFLAT